MANYSSILGGKIAWIEEPGRLQSIGSQRVGHDWVTEQEHRWEVIIFSKKISENVSIKTFLFANLSNVCLNRRQLDSHIFCIQFVATCCAGWSIWRKWNFTWILEKGRIFEYPFLIIRDILLWYYRKTPSGNFLKISCSVKSESKSTFRILLH